MERFFFNLHGAEELLDEEGIELPDLAAVQRRAVYEARALLSADVLTGEIRIDRHFAVTDEGGTIVIVLPFADVLCVRERA